MCMTGAPGIQKRVWDLLGLELEMTVSCHGSAEN